MMPLYAADPQRSAMPATGLKHGASGRSNVLNLADFQHRLGKAPVTKARDPRIAHLRMEDQRHDRPPKLFDYLAAGFIVGSAAFAAAVMWLLVR
jgi:hypothetical protein